LSEWSGYRLEGATGRFQAAVVSNGMSNGHLDSHDCTRVVGIDLQAPAQVPDPLAHSPESNAERTSRLHFKSLFWRYALASIGHFNQDQAIESSNANLGRWTFCMTMDIVRHSCTTRKIAVSNSRERRPKSSGKSAST
jgi:hypothetical protein